ncbi:MAG: thiamine-phosphate kinase [Gammaproteobacteria bacterium]|nr:thiamine-phosphate kinase [Gammaproteobacteria bacterium]
MPVSEFDIIKQYFDRQHPQREGISLGIGDDAALIKSHAGQTLAISIDTLNEGIHFPVNTSAEDIAYKALVVNLSDMAAMGATPVWFTLALSLPEPSTNWLEAFANSLFEIADKYNVTLVGGDTTRGPLSITIQIAGQLNNEQAMLRSGAHVGDQIYVTGTLGDAALALALKNQDASNSNETTYLFSRLNRPIPRVEIGQAINSIASACIDISDGLFADLGHILKLSNVGAQVKLYQLPLSTQAQTLLLKHTELYDTVIKGGDDYELCFCIPKDKQAQLETLSSNFECNITHIGEITDSKELQCLDESGNLVSDFIQGFDHFVKQQ